jgi:pimeloyl-ACP methyl ester carboxylesterase
MRTDSLKAFQTTSQIRLPDGRRLAFRESGYVDGFPVIYFHGFPGSRLETAFADAAAKRQGLRIIGIDRPGFGFSDCQPGRKLIDWPGDVTELADRLGIGRFAVLGVSGGGPYALACAFKIPSRLNAAGTVGGLGPIKGPKSVEGMLGVNRFGLYLSQKVPGLLSIILPMIAFWLRRFPGKILDHVALGAGEPDRAILNNPGIRRLLCDIFRESVRCGYSGLARDLIIYGRPWGFKLEEISMLVYLWHGERDAIVPARMGHCQAGAIPNCHKTFYPGEGHFSIIVNRMEEILSTIKNIILNHGIDQKNG